MVETRTVVAVSAASAALAITGYLIYFDYKRRNDPGFRKKLRKFQVYVTSSGTGIHDYSGKEKKKAAKNAKDGEATTPAAPGRSQEELKGMLDQINAEPLPTLPAEREKYFMDHVGMGEQMLLRGPAFEVPAALAFYRALRAYPSPVEIIMIFQNTLPAHIFGLVMELASLDVSSSESTLASKPTQAKEPALASASAAVTEPESTSAPTTVPAPPAPERATTPPPAPASVQETESEHDSEVMVDADVDTEVEVEAESEAEGEAKADAMSEAEIVPAAHSEPDTESRPEVGAESGADGSTVTQEMSYAEVAAKAAESEPEPTQAQEAAQESHQEPEATHAPEAVPESETKPESEPAAPRDPASVPLGSDSEDDARSETHSETDSYHQVAASQDDHSDWDSLAASNVLKTFVYAQIVKTGYYDVFPPKNMNVKIVNVPVKDKSGQPTESDGKPILRSTLVSNKDIKAGDVIYMVRHRLAGTVVATLDFDLQNLRTHCTHCLRRIDAPISVPDDPLDATYCSKGCQVASKIQSQNVLFGLDPPLPSNSEEPEKPKTEAELVERRKSQEEFVETLRKTGATRALLVARFIACMVAEQSAKLGAAVSPSSKNSSPADLFGLPEPEGDSNTYSFYDHVERLKYLEITETPIEIEEVNALKKAMKNAMEGLEEFVGDRYPLLKGKMAYNAIGVAFGGGRDDKAWNQIFEDLMERLGKPALHFIGFPHTYAAISLSSKIPDQLNVILIQLAHSCAPNVAPSFHTGTSDLHLVANENITSGTELTMAYVDVNQGPTETRLEARRRRRQELARGWRFACECSKCLKEVEEGILEEDKKAEGDAAVKEDLELGSEAKLEDAVRRYESGEKPTPEVDVE
ncbi:MAS20 domain-containing protein [Rhizoctonia solani AG-1 IA]|uniref:MAS20 domain-containing protein n=1 Tax=Thanatephorus cucumeris (strain AG1-IA) TaxID=983506 RepID=L8XA01_THACA|nr:MAS20 domain-containing protein [Rhizoctonia solani AG-1 IA]